MRTPLGLRAIRRQNGDSYHYFIANLTPNDVDAAVPLAVDFQSATLFNPMNGDITPAEVTDGQVRLSLRSGESVILVVREDEGRGDEVQGDTFEVRGDEVRGYENSLSAETPPTNISRTSFPRTPAPRNTPAPRFAPWTLTFLDETPKVNRTFHLTAPQTWETLSDSAAVTMGTGVYTTSFKLNKQQAKQHWMIDLGDVRESARVYINGQFIGCAWAVPFILDCRNTLRKGRNTLRIEVTNLPANRIADMDRRHIPWRKMKEINVVDINYKKTTYDQWSPVPSGLNSTVRLIPKD